MLAYIVIVLVAVYIILDKSGLLADLLGSPGEPTEEQKRRPELVDEGKTDPDADHRLEVFEEFIDQLDRSPDDE